jgi:hypothetical protein
MAFARRYQGSSIANDGQHLCANALWHAAAIRRCPLKFSILSILAIDSVGVTHLPQSTVSLTVTVLPRSMALAGKACACGLRVL